MARGICKSEPFYLVTSALHMPRAMKLFLKQGLNPLAAPSDYPFYWESRNKFNQWAPHPYNLVIINTVWHEHLGRLWEKLRGKS